MATLIRYQPREVVQPGPVVPVRAPQSAAGELAEGLGQVGDMFAVWQDEVDTARAMEADARFTEQLNARLYDPQSGYMHTQGGVAVEQYQSVTEEINTLYEETLSGLDGAARQRALQALQARREHAMTRIGAHAGTARIDYLNQADEARVAATINAAILDPDSAAMQIGALRDMWVNIGTRSGWAPEVIAERQQEAVDTIHSNIVRRLASVDPTLAMDYLRQNRDELSGDALLQLEAGLLPEARAYAGRQQGLEAFERDQVPSAMALARTTLGLHETEQREALRQYLEDGGVNLDPAVVAWCAAFVNATLAQAGFEGTGSYLARSFLNWGVAVTEPRHGDLVVLSRGDPNGPFGHVGFFDGWNEDGTIRLLGGNQDDSVSVASYDPARILGFRRAEGGPRTGVQRLLDIENSTERAAALDEYNLRTQAARGEADAAHRQAVQAAHAWVEAGNPIDQLPLATRQALGREDMAALRSYQNTIVAGRRTVTDPGTYLELRRLEVEDPIAFRETNLLGYVNLLSREDFQGFVDQQQSAAQDRPAGHSVSALMSVAARHLSASNVDQSPNQGSDEATQLATIQERLVRWQDRIIATENRTPSYAEIEHQVATLLAEVFINLEGMGGRQSGRFYEIDFDGVARGPDDDMTLEDLLGARISIQGTRVQRDVLEEAGAALEVIYGRTPTAAEVVWYLIDRGYYGR